MASDYLSHCLSLTTTEDAELVLMVQRGKREAFDEIDHRYRSRLCHFLSRHTRCFHQAEEFAQQTLIRAFEMIDQLRTGEKLAAWLYRIAFCLVIDEVRKNKRKPTTILEGDLPDSVQDAQGIAIAAEERTNLWNIAKNILSNDEFWAIRLRYIENFNTEEIARIMSRSKVSVRVLLFRARNRLLPMLTNNK